MEVGIDEAIKYFFSSPSFDLVYYEAIANSLDAGATEIDITIELPTFSEPKDLKISIKDNGSGFTDKNFRQFSTLLKHKDMQHKGLGRLVYLHYFDQVVVKSTFDTGIRKFVFNKDFKGESEVQPICENTRKETILEFLGFSNEKLRTYDNVRCASVKQHILDTFLPRLYHLQQNSVPFNIVISTITKEENTENNFYSDTACITEKDLPELTKVSLDHSDLSFFCESFDMLYHIDKNTPGNLVTEICVDGRGIDVQILNKKEIPEDISGVFFLQSDFFDSKASDSRQSLNLDEYDERIVKQKFLEAIGEILDRELPMMKKINHRTIEKLSKQFPHLEGYFDEKTIGLLEENQTLEHAQAIFLKTKKKY